MAYDLSPVEQMQDGDVTINRLPIEYSAYYAVQEPVSGEHAPGLLLAFPGYGQSCKGFIKNFTTLRDRNWLVVVAQGPNQFYWERGRPGFCWMTSYMRGNTVRDNLAYVERLLKRLKSDHEFDSRRVFLLGFSQGSAMAFRYAARGGVRPAGVIAAGGDLPPDVEADLEELSKFPVMIVHGNDDTSMHVDKARRGEATLRDHGFSVDAFYFDGAHELPDQAIERIVAWIER